LGFLNARKERGVLGQGAKLLQLREVRDPAIADSTRNRRREPGIGQLEPASRRDPIGLVVEALGKYLCEIFDRRLAQKLRVDRGHSVGAVRSDDRHVRHADVVRVTLLNEAHARGASGIIRIPRANVVKQPAVDLEDDLELARNKEAHPVDRPTLKRLGKQGVIGVGERSARDIPRFVPTQMRFVEQNAHELWHGKSRMGVVELNRGLFGQKPPIRVGLPKPPDRVRQRTGDEKVFLHEPKFAPLRRMVVRIENAGERLGVECLGDRGNEVAAAESLKIE
jgi:hypothetical protein